MIVEEDSLEESKMPSVTAPMQLRKRDLKLDSKVQSLNTSMLAQVTSPISHQPIIKPASANKKVPKQQMATKRSRPGCPEESLRSSTRRNRHQEEMEPSSSEVKKGNGKRARLS